MCEKNPVDSVLFYKKKEPEKAVSRGTEEPVSVTIVLLVTYQVCTNIRTQLNLCVDMHIFWINLNVTLSASSG